MNRPIRDWSGQRVWLLGASSGMGEALARALAARGARLAISARRADQLGALARDLAGAQVLPVDATAAGALEAARETLVAAWGGIDVGIYLAGAYQPMSIDHFDREVAQRMIEVNLVGAMSFAAALAPVLSQQRGGQIALVSSVAGYRGLPKALAYGPSKAALSNFAECLYLDLAPRGVSVRLICPGFVATPMTAGNDFHMPALITAEEAAREILAGFASTAFEMHFPKRFTRVLKFLRLLPHRLYFPIVRRVTGA